MKERGPLTSSASAVANNYGAENISVITERCAGQSNDGFLPKMALSSSDILSGSLARSFGTILQILHLYHRPIRFRVL